MPELFINIHNSSELNTASGGSASGTCIQPVRYMPRVIYVSVWGAVPDCAPRLCLEIHPRPASVRRRCYLLALGPRRPIVKRPAAATRPGTS